LSSLVDIAEDSAPGNLSSLEAELTSAVTATSSEPTKAAPATETSQTSSLPEKLRGKSLEDIANMYVNLESTYGRMANDLGQQRKLTDRLLDLKRAEDLGKQAPPKVEVSTSDFLERPTETLEKFVSGRESQMKETYDQRIAQLEGSLAQQRFEQKHSDGMSLANDPAFVAWVQKSKIRTKAAQAAYAGDWTSADELLTEYKEQRGAAPQKAASDTAAKPTDEAALQAARAAGLDSSGSGSDGSSKTAGKIYRRADLMKLRIEKPDTYYDEGFQAEILRAHAEGRVK
jgi:hypothetical protein